MLATAIHVAHADRATRIREVAALDAELFASAETRALVDTGLDALAQVTERYGSPAAPRQASGEVETDVLMTYHCGGADGHSSTGDLGDGVPRGALKIAHAINHAAGREVIDARARAIAFAAGAWHDHTQLCGRSLAPEGHGAGRGDERISSQAALDAVLAAGASPASAIAVRSAVMATAFDPETKSQVVHLDDADEQTRIVCELVAAADLLSLTSVRGPLGSLEMIAESLHMNSAGHLAQARAADTQVTVRSAYQFYALAGQDTELYDAVTAALAGQSKFFSGWVFQDEQLRQLSGGKGIDALFPGRGHNAATLATYAEQLAAHDLTPVAILAQARRTAGYPA